MAGQNKYLRILVILADWLLGMWHSGSASALHAESPGFDSPHLHVQPSNGHVFDSRWVLNVGTYSSEVERSIAAIMEFDPVSTTCGQSRGLYPGVLEYH